MKKIALFTLLALVSISFNSCDDEKNTGEIIGTWSVTDATDPIFVGAVYRFNEDFTYNLQAGAASESGDWSRTSEVLTLIIGNVSVNYDYDLNGDMMTWRLQFDPSERFTLERM